MGERDSQLSFFKRIVTFAEDRRTRVALGVVATGVAITMLSNPSPTASESQTDITPKTDNPATLVWSPDLNIDPVKLVGSFTILGLVSAAGVGVLVNQDHKKHE